MLRSYTQLITGIVIGLLLGFFVGRQTTAFPVDPVKPAVHQDAVPASAESPRSPSGENETQASASIPSKVYAVLKYIRANHHAMPGYVGGRIFSNREERLPREDNAGRPILYHEWDVNPKREGQNRGTERIITGSDDRAWYTNDHYQSFKEIKSHEHCHHPGG